MKTCSKCGVSKEEAEFYRRSPKAGKGLFTNCKECAKNTTKKNYVKNPLASRGASKNWRKRNPAQAKRYDKASRLRRKYGISMEEYQQMLATQQNHCAICDLTMGEPHIDHSHITGKIRAILCPKCNLALGLFKDSSKLCFLAASYLQRFSS